MGAPPCTQGGNTQMGAAVHTLRKLPRVSRCMVLGMPCPNMFTLVARERLRSNTSSFLILIMAFLGSLRCFTTPYAHITSRHGRPEQIFVYEIRQRGHGSITADGSG